MENTEALDIFKAKYGKVADLEDFTVGYKLAKAAKLKKIKKKGEGKTFFEPFFFRLRLFFRGGAIVRICILGSGMWLHLSRVATRGQACGYTSHVLGCTSWNSSPIVSHCPSIVYMFSV